MIIECAWHKKYFGRKKIIGEKEPLENKKVTHGICNLCEKKFKKEIDSINEIKMKGIQTY